MEEIDKGGDRGRLHGETFLQVEKDVLLRRVISIVENRAYGDA